MKSETTLPLLPSAALFVAVLSSGCTTYYGISEGKAGVYLTGSTSFLIFSVPWAKVCVPGETGGRPSLTCQEMDVNDLRATQTGGGRKRCTTGPGGTRKCYSDGGTSAQPQDSAAHGDEDEDFDEDDEESGEPSLGEHAPQAAKPTKTTQVPIAAPHQEGSQTKQDVAAPAAEESSSHCETARDLDLTVADDLSANLEILKSCVGKNAVATRKDGQKVEGRIGGVWGTTVKIRREGAEKPDYVDVMQLSRVQVTP
jgi:hypothetical protein